MECLDKATVSIPSSVLEDKVNYWDTWQEHTHTPSHVHYKKIKMKLYGILATKVLTINVIIRLLLIKITKIILQLAKLHHT